MIVELVDPSSLSLCAFLIAFSQAFTSCCDSSLTFLEPNSMGSSLILEPLMQTLSTHCSNKTHICCNLEEFKIQHISIWHTKPIDQLTSAYSPMWPGRHRKPFDIVSSGGRCNSWSLWHTSSTDWWCNRASDIHLWYSERLWQQWQAVVLCTGCYTYRSTATSIAETRCGSSYTRLGNWGCAAAYLLPGY